MTNACLLYKFCFIQDLQDHTHINSSHPHFQTTSLYKSNYQLLIRFLFPSPTFLPLQHSCAPSPSSPILSLSPSQPYAGLHNRTAKSIGPRRLMGWRWRCTYKELSWPSEGWNHPSSPEILKTYGAPAKTDRERKRDKEREGEGERVSEISAEFIGSLPVGEGKRNLKSLRKALDLLQ